MYQGKNKTALASQQQIADALLALMHRMPYDDISVAELCREAAVSRQTFYSLFKTKSNVVRYLMQMSCEPNVPAPQPGMSHLRQMCQCYSEYITKHREIMSLLVENGMTEMIVDMLLMAFHRLQEDQQGALHELRQQGEPYGCRPGRRGIERHRHQRPLLCVA